LELNFIYNIKAVLYIIKSRTRSQALSRITTLSRSNMLSNQPSSHCGPVR